MTKALYYNTGKLTKFVIRRDRIGNTIWIIAITLLTLITASAFVGLYESPIERQVMAETMKNPAITAMFGPGYGLDNYTYGAMMAHQMLLFTAIAIAIMSILLVSRHTRGDEEGGRIEVIRSLPVGRLSNLTSTMIVLFIVNLILSVAVGVGLFALGIEGIDLKGSLIYGAALGATGIIFGSMTALFAQLTTTARGTTGYSFAFLGIAYLIRAVGDVSSEMLSLLSPLGWILRTEAYVNNYWWPILLTIGTALVIIALSLYLNSIRDLEAGFIPAKPGRKTASIYLQSPLGLAVRLQRVGIIAWVIGMFILGISYGSVLGDLEAFFENNEMMKELLPAVEGFSLTEQFLTMIMAVIAMVCTIPALIMVFKIKGEEKRNRTEHLLARAISRSQIMGSFLTVSLLVGFLSLFFSVIGLWATGTAVMDEPIAFNTIFTASMAYLPAMLVMISFAVVLIGYIPQGTVLAWLYLGYSFFVVYFGGLLQFPQWMFRISPFGNVPQIPVEDMDFKKLVTLLIIGLITMIIGFKGYNQRDIQG